MVLPQWGSFCPAWSFCSAIFCSAISLRGVAALRSSSAAVLASVPGVAALPCLPDSGPAISPWRCRVAIPAQQEVPSGCAPRQWQFYCGSRTDRRRRRFPSSRAFVSGGFGPAAMPRRACREVLSQLAFSSTSEQLSRSHFALALRAPRGRRALVHEPDVSAKARTCRSASSRAARAGSRGRPPPAAGTPARARGRRARVYRAQPAA